MNSSFRTLYCFLLMDLIQYYTVIYLHDSIPLILTTLFWTVFAPVLMLMSSRIDIKYKWWTLILPREWVIIQPVQSEPLECFFTQVQCSYWSNGISGHWSHQNNSWARKFSCSLGQKKFDDFWAQEGFFCNFISKLLKILLKIIDRISPLQPSVMRGMQSQVIGSHLNSCKKNNIIVPNYWRLVISPHFRGPRISVFGGMTGSRLMNMSLAWKLQIPTRHIPSWPATERGMPRRSNSTATGRRSSSHGNSSSLELVVA